MKTITCKKCGETKPLDEFPIIDRERGWHRHECKSCNYSRVETWHEAHRTERLLKQKDYYYKVSKSVRETPEAKAANRLRIKALYLKFRTAVYAAYGDVCACCGEAEPNFLTIDHVNRDGKEDRKLYRQGLDLFRWIIKNNFPETYQILCFNCNLGRERNNGICPHREGSTTIAQASTAEVNAAGSASDPEDQGHDIVSSRWKQ